MNTTITSKEDVCLSQNFPQQPTNKGDARKKEKSFTINMRIDANRKTLIDEAARSLHQDRTSFVLDAAYNAAIETIKDRNVLIMSTENFDKFEKALSNETIEENKCLLKILNRTPNWRK